MIIVVGGTKGGTGKSTIVMNLAALAVNQGVEVILVDADKQGTASEWSAIRDDNGLIRVPTVQKLGQLALTKEIKDFARKYTHVLVDAGGYDSEELRASIVAADRLYVPIRPAQVDVWTLPRIIGLAQQSQIYNPNLAYFFIINGAHTNPSVKQVDEVLALANDIEGMKFCRTILHTRLAFAKAPSNGMGVTEMGKEKDEKACAEVMSLYEEVFGD